MARHRKYVVKLSDEEVQRLKKIIRNVKTSQTIRSRCQILLLLDMAHGQTYNYEECATVTGTCIATVSNTVKNYCTEGLEKLLILDRSINSDNARRKVDGRTEAKIELDTPISREAIRRALKKTNFDLTSQSTGVSQTKKIQNL